MGPLLLFLAIVFVFSFLLAWVGNKVVESAWTGLTNNVRRMTCYDGDDASAISNRNRSPVD